MFQGSIVALITPMDANGEVAYDRVPSLLSSLLAQGTSGVVVAGTTGESASLSLSEYQGLLELVVSEVAGRVPVLAGTGAASTRTTIEQTKLAQRLGVDAALVVTPYYYRPMPTGMQAHYETLVGATDLPVVLYNVPSRTAVDLSVSTVEKLAALEQVVAIKEATPGSERIRQLLDACGDRLTILSGDDGTCTEAMLAGAAGVISVAANVAPAHFSRLCDLALSGDREGALAAQKQLEGLIGQLSVESNPIPVKWAAYELDLAGPGIRLPLLPLEEQYRAGLRTSLEQLGLLTRRED